ncbi:transketolase [Conexibacter sp. CPCC 206217]|uniref:transketolase n=1 Tax=Conexibacter sp. CPCC 206217 TaxID=3064574 RepID=UPI00272733C6|nr:transketolase [Conexibacter sp. CPCC 206217]MDO8209600.1 transketolase [Conexibacter sp. CPCC 206217]
MTGASIDQLRTCAARLRAHAIRIAAGRGQGYVGQALGTAEIMSCLFFDAMRLEGPQEDHDRFVLSPGHYALTLYAVQLERGLYDPAELETYGMDGSRIEESPLEGLPGFEITGGSLAQGLSQAVGLALGARLQGRPTHVYCMISDGELQEGQTWEALLSAAHHGLDNLTIVLDRNRRQVDGSTEEVVSLEPVADKLAAFGSEVVAVDGHDVAALQTALRRDRITPGKPTAVVARTALGRGVPAFEHADYPHYLRLPQEQWDAARRLIGVDAPI